MFLSFVSYLQIVFALFYIFSEYKSADCATVSQDVDCLHVLKCITAILMGTGFDITQFFFNVL